MAMSTPSSLKPNEPLRTRARKPDRGGEGAKEYRPSQFRHRGRDRLPVRLAVGARLLIAAENQDGKIDSEPDEDGAETDRDHVQLAEDEKADGQADQAGKQQGESHARQAEAIGENR